MSTAEWILALDFILLLLLWTVGDLYFGIPATVSAFIGLVILLLSNIMTWKNIVEDFAKQGIKKHPKFALNLDLFTIFV